MTDIISGIVGVIILSVLLGALCYDRLSTPPIGVRARIAHAFINVTVIVLGGVSFVFHIAQCCLDDFIDWLEDRRP